MSFASSSLKRALSVKVLLQQCDFTFEALVIPQWQLVQTHLLRGLTQQLGV